MESTEAGASSAVPLPADTVGKVKVRLSASGEATSKGDDSGSQGGQQAMTSGERTDAAAKKAASARDDATPAGTSDRKASFTPADTTAAATPAPSAPTVSTSPAGSGSSYSGSSYTPQPSYTRSEWSTGLDPVPAAAGASTVTASAPPPDSAGSPQRNGYSSSRFSSGTGAAGAAAAGTASAIGGAAAGLANSVSTAWQKRGSASKGIQTRKSTKRQAMLTLARVEPWSVMKFSFVASVVAFIILFVAVAVLYMVLAALGVFDSIQHTVTTMTSAQGSAGTNISHWTSPSLILGYTAMLGALNIVLITAMATVGSVIYNLIAKTIGGIEVTLRETD
jgi:hypothetical protein